ncbi:MAG: hypothetical protein HQK54_17580, partial [Oligoflexales bacterium]|nr:hypothetical protein [Oligoflexales bacterium]
KSIKAAISHLFQISLFFVILFAGQGFSFEIYRFVDNSCKSKTGVIVNIDDEKIYLLTVDGRYEALPRKDADYILVYNVINNPIASVDLTGDLKEMLREVYVSNVETPAIIGWPIQFVENLIVFFDLQGKSNLIDQDKLLAIKPSLSTPGKVMKIQNATPMNFSLGNNLSECRENPEGNTVQPTRMISDKIRVNKFLYGYEKGFSDLKRFQRRTRFYARPFLFDKTTRIGFAITNKEYLQEPSSPLIPFYIQWSNGRPYSHQSVISVGYKPVEWLPNVEPVFAARSDLKLHFFHASLAGNLIALPAGRSYMVESRMLLNDFFQELGNKDATVLTHFNYLALSGVDFENYSISLGIFYPLFAVAADGYFKEILATKSAVATRFMYTTASSRFKLIYSSSDASSSSPDEREIRIKPSSEMQGGDPVITSNPIVNSMERFKFKSFYVRTGLDLDINADLRAGLDEVFLDAIYEDVLYGRESRIRFNQYTTATYVRQQFGNYVALIGYLNLIYRTYDDKIGNENDRNKSARLSGSVAVEFML